MINLVVALAAEARPVIDAFDLVEVAPGVFRRDGVALVISGIGKEAAARATAGFQDVGGRPLEHAWLNIGLAGHRRHEIGRAFLAHSVEDDGVVVWFPPITGGGTVPSAAVRTVTRPETRYEDDVLYEMEAAGFVREAIRRSTGELVQVLKIVSDNRKVAAAELTAAQATRLVARRLPTIERVIGDLQRAADELKALRRSVPLGPWRELWHFTVTQQRQLRHLLNRLEVADVDGAPSADQLAHEPNARAVLAALREQLEELPVAF